MGRTLKGRSFLKELDFTAEELRMLVALAADLKAAKRAGYEQARLVGRNIALIFEKTSTRTRTAFEVAAHDQGAHVTYLGPNESQLGAKESVKDTARVLGRIFDGIEYRGFAHDDVEILSRYAGVPVWNGLTDQWHPTQMLADILTMQEHSTKRPTEISYCYLGDARNNTARSLLITGAILGMDVRIAAPEELWPDETLRKQAETIAQGSGARLQVSAVPDGAVSGVDFLYTDVWVSMGEAAEEWDRRIPLLSPYQINAELVAATGNPDVKVMHCLPALHDRHTRLGEVIAARTGLEALEITDEVFESPHSIVFDQAENRMPTIKAVMLATLEG